MNLRPKCLLQFYHSMLHFVTALWPSPLQDGSQSIPPAILYSDARAVEEVAEVFSGHIVEGRCNFLHAFNLWVLAPF